MKTIPISKGMFALVDDEDFEWLSKMSWYYSNGYAMTSTRIYGSKKRNKYAMHRFIMMTWNKSVDIDHIDGNRLNNQRSNLRIATRSQNHQNRKPLPRKGGYKGVGWHSRDNAWRAYIKVDGRQVSLGYFQDRDAAARAYDQAAIRHYGEFARLNFPV
jgi:hypothetical protein